MRNLKRPFWKAVLACLIAVPFLASAAGGAHSKVRKCYMGKYRGDKVVKTDAEWKKILTPEQYEVLRGEGTELACSGPYWNMHAKGVYFCAGCGLELFVSDTKFDSKTGWPSFYTPAYPENVATREDHSHGMDRVEVHCPRCGGHLGHVFEDGPAPTGLRYCINSLSIVFVPDKKQ